MLTSACESSGFVRAKSSLHVAHSSISRCMFGWIEVLITPPSRSWIGTTSNSGSVQPFSSVRVDHVEHDERDADRHRRLQQLDEEVRAVLELVQRSDLEEEPGEPHESHQWDERAGGNT